MEGDHWLMKRITLCAVLGFLLAVDSASAGTFKCNFRNQPAMVISLSYPEPPTVTIEGTVYPLENTPLPVMTASIGGSTYEFGIKNYGATNNTMPAKLEIRSGGWGGGGQVAYSEKTVCVRLN
jgi:hypothetical protein